MDTQDQVIEQEAPAQEPDQLEGIDDSYDILDERHDEEGFLIITIKVKYGADRVEDGNTIEGDSMNVNVQDKNAPDRAGVLLNCARTAKEIRYNKSKLAAQAIQQ